MADTHVLVIDDEPVVLESCRRIFSDRGWKVTVTASPREALGLVAAQHFDLIVSDWKMPEMDGVDLVEVLDKRAPDAAIVMITGYPSVDRATEVMKRGAMDFLAKPFTPDELTGAADRALTRKRQTQTRETSRIERIVKTFSLSFPVPSLDDQSPKTIAETVAEKVGVGKATSPWLSVVVLGVLAGAYIAFGAMLATTLTFDLAPRMGLAFTKFMSGAAFSLGLMLVVIAGAELFTGNNLMISSVMTGRVGVGTLLGRWGVMYAANFAGSILLALLFVFSGLWKTGDGALGAFAVRTAYVKVSLPFLEALLRGIGCNWLVCLAVWMALASRQVIGKIFAIFFPIMAFVALGFEHSVANMYFIPTGLFLRAFAGVAAPEGMAPGALSWASFALGNLVPVTIGNVIGGVVFVGMGYWGAYIRAPIKASKK
jgi:formate/nitrite transporter